MIIAAQNIKLKNGYEVLLKTPEPFDAEKLLTFMQQMYAETDFMARTVAEVEKMNVEGERKFLEKMNISPNGTMIAAYLDGKIIGNCGIHPRTEQKYAHRATFGISVLQEFWNMGVGSALTEHTLSLAKQAGYEQIELATVSINVRAIALYKKFGFEQTGIIPRAQKLENGQYYDYIYMVKAL